MHKGTTGEAVMKATKRAGVHRLALVLLALGLATAALAAPGAALAAGGGDVLWSVPFSGAQSDGAVAVAAGPSGSALLSGTLTRGSSNVVVLKESEAGTPDWLMTWGGALARGARTTAAAYDAAHQCLYLVAGIADPVHSSALAVIKVDAAGGVVWTRTWSARSTSSLDVHLAAVDTRGDLYIAGAASYEGAAEASEAVLVKFSPRGTQLWESSWWYGAGVLSVNDLAVSPSGVATCAGARLGDGETSRSFVRATAASGRRLWMRTFGGRGDTCMANAVAPGPRGSAIAAGARRSGGVSQGVAEKYSASGRLLWRRAVSTGSSGDGFLDVAVRRDGAVFASGASTLEAAGPYVVALRPSGRVLWKSQWAAEGWGQRIVVAGARVYVGGGLVPVGLGAPETIGVECLKAADGGTVWQRSYDLGAGVNDAGVLDLVVVPGHSVFVAAGLNDAVTGGDGRFLRLAP
jgi:hypothetical protein